MTAAALAERWVEHRGYRVWTGTAAGDPTRPPLVCVPGGPGLSHAYLAGLAALAARGGSVIFYDPVGCGASDRPTEIQWSLDFVTGEIVAVLDGLALPRAHLYAHSFGGIPAVEVALAHPQRTAGLILSSVPLDVREYMAVVLRFIAELGPELGAALARGEYDPRARDLAYARAYYEYVKRHICRLTPLPDVIRDPGYNWEAHRALKGGLLLYTGALRRWSALDRLGALAAPALLCCGRHDAVTAAACRAAAGRMPRAEVEVFADSSHLPHLEEPERYRDVLSAFLARADQAPATSAR